MQSRGNYYENTQVFKSNPGGVQMENGSGIKDVMNTSAPICISSYIKGSSWRGANAKPIQRRGTSGNYTRGGRNPNAEVGMISGQTMNLARA